MPAPPRPPAPLRRRFLLLWALGFALCIAAGGFLRHAGDEQAYPLVQRRGGLPLPDAATFNPGRWDYRTWWHWRAISVGDFEHVFDAARERRLSPEVPMYRPEELYERPASFVYTPFAALLLAPFAGPGATLERAADGVSIVNHLLIAACLAMLAGLALPGRRASPLAVGTLVLVGALFFPFASALSLTQAGSWITFGLCLSSWLLFRGHSVASGLALAFAVSIKPHLVLVPAVCLVAGGFRRSWFVALAAGLATTTAASIAFAGWDNCLEYVTGMLPALSSGFAFYRNQSFHGLLLRISGQDGALFELAERVLWIDRTAGLLGLATVAATALLLRRRPRPAAGGRAHADSALVLGLAICAGILASPVTWMHHFGPFAIPAALLWARLEASARRRVVAPLALLVGWLLVGYHFDASGLARGPVAVLSGLELYGALIFLAASLTLVGRAGPAASGDYPPETA